MELPIIYDDCHWTVRKNARLQYINEQDGLCCHCKTNLYDSPSEEVEKLSINTSLFPRGMFDHPIHLHHDRKTGLTIGAVHAKCNATLWQYHGE